jgi:hypothetical protein
MREVVFKLSLADNMHARAGRRELKHAFACVLLDVLEATPEGGEIEIKAGDEDGWIRVTISSASARVEKTHDDAIDFHVARDTARACGGELYAESLRRVCFKLPASPGAAGTS